MPLLIAPALFEEMNRTRRLLAHVCAALAQAGVRSCLPDLPGTGDHADTLAAATVGRWRAALAALAAVIGGGGGMHILAVRAGALIAPETGVRTLYRIAPPANGTKPLRDLLRARVAGAAESGDAQTVTSLDAASRAGAYIDAIGYRLSPALAQGLRDAQPVRPSCPTRTVATAPGVGIDAAIPAPPPWLHADPDNVEPLAVALAADWRAWVASHVVAAQ